MEDVQKYLKHITINYLNFISIAILVLSVPLTLNLLSQHQQSASHAAGTTPDFAWEMFGGDAQHSNIDNNETLLTPSTVNNLRVLWSRNFSELSGQWPDSSFVYLANVPTAMGLHNIIYGSATHGTTIAIDAETGATLWKQSTSGNGSINSSPVIDPSHQFVYGVGADGKVHKYAVGTGIETMDSNWPLVITLLPSIEHASSALTIGNGYLYATISAYNGDGGHYVGHIVARNLTTNTTTVFNAMCANLHVLLIDTQGANYCADAQSGIWARAGVVLDPTDNSVYAVTGNGTYNVSRQDYGDTLVKLSADLLTILDTYTPTNFLSLQQADQDLGSAAPVILPILPSSNTPSLLVLGGKDGVLRLINRTNLSGQGGPNHTGGELQTVSLGCAVFTQPIAWTDTTGQLWLFVNDYCNNVFGFKINTVGGVTSLQQVYKKTGIGGSSAVLVNGMLFYEQGDPAYALDAKTGNPLWQGSIGGGLHWESVTVANGHVFLPNQFSSMTAYSIPSTGPTNTPGPSPTPSLTPTPSRIPTPSLTPTPLPGQVFGYTTVGGTTGSGEANSIVGSRYTTGTSGLNITSMSVYVGAVDNTSHNQYQLAIYTANPVGLKPKDFVASSAIGTLTANSWNTINISASLAPNTTYFLMYNNNGTTANVNNTFYDTTSLIPEQGATVAQTFGTWPSSIPVAQSCSCAFSIYATGTLAPTPTDTPTPTLPSGGTTFGYPTIGTLQDSGENNNIEGTRFQTGSSSLSIVSMSAYIGTSVSAPNNQYQMAIYTANANGTPNTLVAQSSIGTVTGGTWNTLPISATLAPNTNYFIMYATNGENNMKYTEDLTISPENGAYIGHTFGTMPATLTGTTECACTFSIYATASGGSVTSTPTITPIPPTNTPTPSRTPTPAPTSTPTPTSLPTLPGDINGDGHVDVGDLSLLADNFGLSGGGIINPNADINHDGKVDVVDLSILADHFGQ